MPDSRNNSTPRRNANLLVAKLRPHGVFFGGDMTDNGTNSQWIEWFNDWQLTIGSDGRMIPIVAARGNHESSNSILVNLFDVPSSEVYFALTFGGNLLRAYTLNTETSITGSQTSWLSSDLQNNSSVTWKMAQYHKPMRPHVSYKSEGNTQYSAWANLFYQHGVKLVVECDAHTVKTTWPVKPSTGSGSDEGFVREDNAGTTYVGEGCWGAPLRTNDDNKAWTRASGRFNQFKWIFVDRNKIEVRTIKVDNASSVGTVSDSNPFAAPANLDIWNPAGGAVVTILPNGISTPDPGSNVVDVRVNASANDAEEAQNGTMYLNSSDLELVYDSYKSAGNQKVGVRFTGVGIPKGATVTKAYIQFTTDETKSGSTSLSIRAHNSDNASAFTSTANNISSRSLTSGSVSWSPAAWNSVGESGSAQRTPELKSLVQAVVNRSGWQSGNAVVFVLSGSGVRTAESYDGSSGQAPLLHIEYETSGGTSPNPGIDAITLNRQISSGIDDVEEESDGDIYTNSSDLELVYDNWARGNQHVGLRFRNISIPQGATIEDAYIQFTTDETNSGGTNLTVWAHDTDNASQFSTNRYNVSSRSKTSASAAWAPSAWNSVSESGSNQRTPNLKSLVQEVVNRGGWQSGNALAFIISGSGERTAEAYEGNSSQAARLVVTYRTNGNNARLASSENSEAQAEANATVVALETGLKVHPNPFTQSLTLVAPQLAGERVQMYLLSQAGFSVLRAPITFNEEGTYQLDLGKLATGTYLVVVEAQGKQYSQRIIKH